MTIYIHYGSDHFDPELLVPTRNAGSTDFGFRPSERVTEQEKIQIRWMLSRINGSEVVKNMNPDELAEWVMDLKENGTEFSLSDMATIAGAMMRRK